MVLIYTMMINFDLSWCGIAPPTNIHNQTHPPTYTSPYHPPFQNTHSNSFLSSKDMNTPTPSPPDGTSEPPPPGSSLPAWARSPDNTTPDNTQPDIEWGAMPFPSSGVEIPLLSPTGAPQDPGSDGGTPIAPDAPSGFGSGWQNVFRGGRIFEPLAQRAPTSTPSSSSRTMPVADWPLVLGGSVLDLPSQDAQDVAAARGTTLPPLQSVVELTTAWKPPVRTGQETEAELKEQQQATGVLVLGGEGVLFGEG